MADEQNTGEAEVDATFVTRGVSATDVSAVSAVLRGLLREESDELRSAPTQAPDAWRQSQRPIRTPLHPGAGQWRGFRN